MRISRRFRPCNLNGCVLYLPFYAYGAEQTTILDISGQGNHGTITGAVPGSYPMLDGSVLVTNGTFTGDTGWTKGTGWAITTVATKTAGVASDLEQDIGAVAAIKYFLKYTLTRTAGSITPQIGGANGTARSADGIYTDEIAATGIGNLKFQADASFAGTVDNVSVQKIPGYESLGWYFDGSNDYLNCGNDVSLNFTTQNFTFLFWLYPSISSGTGEIFARTPDTITGYYCEADSSGNIYLVGFNNIVVLGLMPMNAWSCWAFTRSGSSGNAYKNGSLVTGPVTLANAATSTAVFTLAAWEGPASFAKTFFGEFLAFNREFTNAEIKSFFELTRGKYSI